MFLEAGVPLPRACHSPGTPPPHQAGKTNWPQGEAAGGESRPTRQAQRAGLAVAGGWGVCMCHQSTVP